MFRPYEFQIPRTIRLSRGGPTLGPFILGMCSALIVGPGVAAPLAGTLLLILLLISRTGNVVFGGVGVLALSPSTGSPRLMIGTPAGHLLSKA